MEKRKREDVERHIRAIIEVHLLMKTDLPVALIAELVGHKKLSDKEYLKLGIEYLIKKGWIKKGK